MAKRHGDVALAADILYGALPELDKRVVLLSEEQKQDTVRLKHVFFIRFLQIFFTLPFLILFNIHSYITNTHLTHKQQLHN